MNSENKMWSVEGYMTRLSDSFSGDWDTLLSVIIHDLRNRVGGIVGCATLIQDDTKPMSVQEIQTCVKIIRQNGIDISNVLQAIDQFKQLSDKE